jgi:hypothetical protein
VSVGMPLVFNASIRFKRIASVYAGAGRAKSTESSSKSSGTEEAYSWPSRRPRLLGAICQPGGITSGWPVIRSESARIPATVSANFFAKVQYRSPATRRSRPIPLRGRIWRVSELNDRIALA